MTSEQAAAYVFSQSVAAMAMIEGMKVTNRERVSHGHTEAYDEEAFLQVAKDFDIGCNDVLSLFKDY